MILSSIVRNWRTPIKTASFQTVNNPTVLWNKVNTPDALWKITLLFWAAKKSLTSTKTAS